MTADVQSSDPSDTAIAGDTPSLKASQIKLINEMEYFPNANVNATPTTQTIETLRAATDTLLIQSEVSNALNSLVTDIETAHFLTEKLRQDHKVAELERRVKISEDALAEYKAMEWEKKKESEALGDLFVRDIITLGVKWKELEQQTCNSEKVSSCNNDKVISDDFQTEKHSEDNDKPEVLGSVERETGGNIMDEEEKKESLNEEKESHSVEELQKSLKEDVDEVLLVNPEESEKDTVLIPNTEQNPTAGISNEKSSDIVVGENFSSEVTLTDSSPKKSQKESETTVAGDNVDVSVKEKAKVKRVKIRRKKVKKERIPTLQDLDGKLLLTIFEYIDALDIVNMAQTNIALYSKVDSIFGLGGSVILSSPSQDLQEEEESEYESEYEEIVEEEELSIEGDIQTQDLSPTEEICMTPQASNVSGFAKDAQEDIKCAPTSSQATIVSLPPSTSNQSFSSSGTVAKMPEQPSQAPALKVDTDNDPKESQLNDSSLALPTLDTANKPAPTFHMSAGVAKSLSSKLSPAELSAIISMRDQLRKKSKDMKDLQSDYDDLTAQVVGIVSVKEVLTEKMKTLQSDLISSQEVAAKVTRQTSSDQEVISFLDERVQELEKNLGRIGKEQLSAYEAVQKIKTASEKQVAVLSDLLTFERDQLESNEKEWKSTKKLLVKEVKHCRAQIMAVEAEKEGLRNENEQLREALLSVGISSGQNRSKSFDFTSL